jgi:hypothetical protein
VNSVEPEPGIRGQRVTTIPIPPPSRRDHRRANGPASLPAQGTALVNATPANRTSAQRANRSNAWRRTPSITASSIGLPVGPMVPTESRMALLPAGHPGCCPGLGDPRPLRGEGLPGLPVLRLNGVAPNTVLLGAASRRTILNAGLICNAAIRQRFLKLGDTDGGDVRSIQVQ